MDFELACVLYNIGALHGELGALDSRNNAESMKVACTHFQCAVWAFETLKDDSRLFKSRDISHDILTLFIQVMLAQAQECILEKSMLDNRKSSIVAKVAAQVVEYYNTSLAILLQAAMNTTGSDTIMDIVGSKLYKEWKKFIEFKVIYYNAICSLYMGNLSEELQKMGDRVAWYQSAESKLNEAVKLGKYIDKNETNEALTFVADVISVKLSNARKENDFVYHEKVPSFDKLTEVKGVSLVKGIPFSVTDPEICGQDIFARLVPIEAHETASIYSAQKDEILRKTRLKIDEKNQELEVYLSSLNVDRDTLRSRDERIPDELIEVCAAMSVNPSVINEVQTVLNELEEMCNEVDRAIKEIKNMLKDEEEKESLHQKKFGKRPPSMIIVELSKELAKHEETHQKAVESNVSLKENLERHIDDVKLLINSSANDIASLLPSTTVNVPINEEILKEMDKLFSKIDEMKSQRLMLENQLKEAMDSDDVMKLVLAHAKEEVEIIFQKEIKKYDKFVSLLDQNMSAQENILRALTKTNAKYSETKKALLENQRNRRARIESLLQTYEIFQEIKTNSKKGVEFYKKFQNIVFRLLARVRGVTKVQDEERLQFSLINDKKNKTKLNYRPELNTMPSTIRNPIANDQTFNYLLTNDQLQNAISTKPPEVYSTPTPTPTPTANFSVPIPTPIPNFSVPTPTSNFSVPTPTSNFSVPTPTSNFSLPTTTPNFSVSTPTPSHSVSTATSNFAVSNIQVQNYSIPSSGQQNFSVQPTNQQLNSLPTKQEVYSTPTLQQTVSLPSNTQTHNFSVSNTDQQQNYSIPGNNNQPQYSVPIDAQMRKLSISSTSQMQNYSVPNYTHQSNYSIQSNNQQYPTSSYSEPQNYTPSNYSEQNYSFTNNLQQAYSIAGNQQNALPQTYSVPSLPQQVNYPVSNPVQSQNYSTITNGYSASQNYLTSNSQSQTYATVNSQQQTYPVVNSQQQTYSTTNSQMQNYSASNNQQLNYSTSNNQQLSYSTSNNTIQSQQFNYSTANSYQQDNYAASNYWQQQGYSVPCSVENYQPQQQQQQLYQVSNYQQQQQQQQYPVTSYVQPQNHLVTNGQNNTQTPNANSSYEQPISCETSSIAQHSVKTQNTNQNSKENELLKEFDPFF